jgi:hypothetical protein
VHIALLGRFRRPRAAADAGETHNAPQKPPC